MSKVFKFFFSRFENFFLWSSGVNRDILSQVPTEKSKYFGIGGTIVFTAIMASFAGGYAFFTAFKSVNLSVPFGVFWGMLIFNLDRYIVASFGVGDGKKTISKQELIEAAPRLAMAFILGLVISTPLELKLFENEINVEIAEIIKEKRNELASKDSSYVLEKAQLQKEISKLEQDERNAAQGSFKTLEKNEVNQLTPQRQRLESELQGLINNRVRNEQFLKRCQQISNNNCSVDKYNYNVSCNRVIEKEKEIKSIDDQINSLNKIDTDNLKAIRNKNQIEINEKKSRIKVLDGIINGNNESGAEVSKQYNGFMARMEAFSRLKDTHFSLKLTGFLITLLFIFIEIAPILFKMMTERGPYDDIIDRIKHETMVRQLEIQSEINQEINTTLKTSEQKAILKMEMEIQTYEEILNEVSRVHKELSLISIENWKKEQIEFLANSKQDISKDSEI
jgi:hypothetical protein